MVEQDDTEREERVPPEEWIPEKPHDYSEWMDKPAPLYMGDLTDEQRKKLIPNPEFGG